MPENFHLSKASFFMAIHKAIFCLTAFVSPLGCIFHLLQPAAGWVMRYARETEDRAREPDPWISGVRLGFGRESSWVYAGTKWSQTRFQLRLRSKFLSVCFRWLRFGHIPCSLAWSLLTWLSQIAFSWQPRSRNRVGGEDRSLRWICLPICMSFCLSVSAHCSCLPFAYL